MLVEYLRDNPLLKKKLLQEIDAVKHFPNAVRKSAHQLLFYFLGNYEPFQDRLQRIQQFKAELIGISDSSDSTHLVPESALNELYSLFDTVIKRQKGETLFLEPIPSESLVVAGLVDEQVTKEIDQRARFRRKLGDPAHMPENTLTVMRSGDPSLPDLGHFHFF